LDRRRNPELVPGSEIEARVKGKMPIRVIFPLIFVTTKSTKDTKIVLKDKSLDSLFQHLNVKVDQQPNVHLGEFHVRQNPRLVNFEQLIYALQLNDQPVINKKVNTVSTIKLDLFVVNR
jgi:hypothetical protein